MLSTHHYRIRRGHWALGLVSVLVLLAFTCAPAFARADSGEIQYQDAPPTITGNNTPPSHTSHPSTQESTAHQSTVTGGAQAPGGESSNPGSTRTNSSAGDHSSATGNGPATGGGDKQQSSQGHGPSDSAKQHGQAGQPSASASSDSGGSSPLIPILIAILVLAGISVGVVVVRAKRQQRGPQHTSVSPKAS